MGEWNMDIGDIITNIIAIASLVVSILVARKNSNREKKIKKRDLNDAIFLEIYQKYMIREIPEAVAKISIVGNGELSGAKEYAEVLRRVKSVSIYYRYSDITFYNKIVGQLGNLEDYLVNNLRGKYTGDEQQKVLSDIQAKTQIIYETLTEQRMKL